MLKTLAISISLLIGANGGSETDEKIVCKVDSLEKHGFTQLSEDYTEKACVNILNNTDFIIINADEFKSKENDILSISLNSYSEVVKMNEVYKSKKEK